MSLAIRKGSAGDLHSNGYAITRMQVQATFGVFSALTFMKRRCSVDLGCNAAIMGFYGSVLWPGHNWKNRDSLAWLRFFYLSEGGFIGTMIETWTSETI